MILLELFVSDWKTFFGQIYSEKILCLIWCLVARQIQIYVEYNGYVFFVLIFTKNILFGQVWSKQLKFSVPDERWFLD